MNPDEVTAQIIGAWDEIQADDEQAVLPVSAEDEPKEDEQNGEEEADEESDADADEEEEEEDEAEDEEEDDGEQEGESVTAAFDSDDPEIQAYLAKYRGDLGSALRGAVELQRVLGRQGSEKAAALERVLELEAQLTQATAFQGDSAFLSPEQAQWVEEASTSQNPARYIQRAVQEGEYELARAVVREWAREQPYEAMRAGQAIDEIEVQQWDQANAQAPAAEPQNVDTGVLLNVLADNFPDMRAYEPQMVGILNQWGASHPLVIDARTGDIPTAAKAIIAIYEAARASSASVQGARDGLKRKNRQAADEAREAAVVSSASATPSAGETPRRKPIMPGLSLEAFEAEFSQQ